MPNLVPLQLLLATFAGWINRHQAESLAAVRSHIEKLQRDADGSYDLYFGPKAPAGKESMWIKTIPGNGWLRAFRIYGPTAAAFDGTWKLDDIVEMK